MLSRYIRSLRFLYVCLYLMPVLQGDFPGSLFSALPLYKYNCIYRYSVQDTLLQLLFSSILSVQFSISFQCVLSTDSIHQGLWLENGLI